MPRPRWVSLHSSSVALSFGSSFFLYCIRACSICSLWNLHVFLGRKMHNFLIFSATIWTRDRALYYESTAGVVWWRPDCRMEPRLTPPGEDCLEIHLLLVPSHNIWPHRDTKARPNHLWFYSPRTTSFLALIQIWIWYFAGLLGLLRGWHY
jgi:hypothetical protein